jgi:hypothetical protein
MPLIPALCRLRKEDLELEASLGYIVRSHLKKQKQKQTTAATTKSNVKMGTVANTCSSYSRG